MNRYSSNEQSLDEAIVETVSVKDVALEKLSKRALRDYNRALRQGLSPEVALVCANGTERAFACNGGTKYNFKPYRTAVDKTGKVGRVTRSNEK